MFIKNSLLYVISMALLLVNPAHAKTSENGLAQGYSLFLVNYNSGLCGLETPICEAVYLGDDETNIVEKMTEACNPSFGVNEARCFCQKPWPSPEPSDGQYFTAPILTGFLVNVGAGAKMELLFTSEGQVDAKGKTLSCKDVQKY